MADDIRLEPAGVPLPEVPAPVELRTRVERSLLVDQVFEVLRRRIARGDWAPGEQLRIREVAALVGTSEMPVREAVRRLAQAGLVTVEPYKGARVRVLRIDEVEHVYDLRLMLEPEAGRLGALRADGPVVERMRHHWERIQAATDQGEIAESVAEDEHLLDALYGVGENDVLTGLVRGLWDTCRPYKNLWVQNAAAQDVATFSHIPPLIEAVADNDSDEVFAILRQTYTDARAVVQQLLEQTGAEQ